MIIICPECSTRYVVAGSSIGDEGRTVKCANCGHQWFQDGPKKKKTHTYQDEMPDLDFDGPDPEQIVEEELEQAALPEPEPDFEKVLENIADEVTKIDEEDDEDFDAIPEAVKPIPEEEDDEESKSRIPANLPSWIDMAAGYGAAAAIFFLLIGILALMKDTVVSAWPPSAVIYETFGADIAYAGEGLIFDRVNAKTELQSGQTILKLSGTVINLKSESITLPPILASLQTDSGETAASWIIDPGTQSIDAESAIPFDMEYELAGLDVTNASVMFLSRMPENAQSEDMAEEEGMDETEPSADEDQSEGEAN
ncbi:MAG: zinc-ribbon domain-containing protein [Pseudomonadota bacterium]